MLGGRYTGKDTSVTPFDMPVGLIKTQCVADSVVDIAYEHATANLAGQRARLDNLRTRAGTVISAASVVAAFLGGQALDDTKIPKGGGEPIADHSLQLGEIVAFVSFLAIICLCAAIIRPVKRGWTFRLNADKVLRDYADAGKTPEETKRELASYMEGYYVRNEKQLSHLFLMVQGGLVLLALEALALMLDLTT
jgi:hypothetical protein